MPSPEGAAPPPCKPEQAARPRPAAPIRARGTAGGAVLGLSALGIVFGDIGTSPLYTLKTVFDLTGANPAPETVLGVLSLIIWTLIIITTLKYVVIAMSIDKERGRRQPAPVSPAGQKKPQATRDRRRRVFRRGVDHGGRGNSARHIGAVR